MDFGLDDTQAELASLAERVFTDRATPDRVVAAEAGDERVDRELWRTLAGAGLLGVVVPEEHGGAGLGIVEACLVLEQQGRRVAPVPLHGSLVGALAVATCGTPAQRSGLLPAVAAGDAVLACALAEPPGVDPLAPDLRAEPDGTGWRLHGDRWTVPAGHVAAAVLVPARRPDGTPAVFLLDPAGDGVQVEWAETTDRSVRPHLHLTGAPAHLLGDPAAGADTLARLHRWAVLGWCALQVGVVEQAVALTASYVTERHQFGRPLASFQAVTMRAADAYLDTEAVRLTLLQAAWRLATGRAADREVLAAAWWAAEAGHRVTHTTQHLHGGIGADVEFPIHRYFLWAKQIGLALGGASTLLARLGDRLAADAVAGATLS